MYEAVCDAIFRELDKMEDKYKNGSQLTMTDLDEFDRMVHALKCHATYEAMTGERERRNTRYEERYRRY